ncbi:MAG: glycerol-3-phosphate 1-O-acyltransferase PlsY [Hyphomicrobiaceae bacterium]
MTLPILLALAGGYLLGSIPFGLLLTRAAGLGDIRAVGSGNIGATNVLRTGNKALAAATLVLDALKGTAAVLIAHELGGTYAGYAIVCSLAAGLGAFLGHLFPLWLGFKGGKGVATYIGVLIGLEWRLAIAFCFVWLLTAVTSRYSSLSALAASILVPALAFCLGDTPTMLVAAIMSALLIWKHRGNIQRLLGGTEPRIGAKT